MRVLEAIEKKPRQSGSNIYALVLALKAVTCGVKVALVVKNPPTVAGDIKRPGFDPWVQKVPWRREQQPTPVFLPGESHGQRGLVQSMESHSRNN